MILPLAAGTYLEVVEVLDHPASDKAPFGQAVRARSALGGGWLGWVVAVDDITVLEQRLGRDAVHDWVAELAAAGADSVILQGTDEHPDHLPLIAALGA